MTARGSAAELGFLVMVPAVGLVFFPWVASPFALKQDIAPLLFAAALIYWSARGGGLLTEPNFPTSPSARAAILFAACAAGSNLAAQNPPEAWLAFSLLLLGVLLYLFGHLRVWSADFPKRFAQVVYWTSLPISLLGIAQALRPGALDFGLQALGKMAAFSTLGNPQFVAEWLVFSIPLYPALAPAHSSIWARLGTALVALAGLTCLALTRSVSGLLALAAVGPFAVLITTPRAGVRRMASGLTVLVPVAAVVLGLATHSGRGRLMIWTETLLIWMRHPLFGVGLGQYNVHQLEAQHRFFALGPWTDAFQQNAAFVLDAHDQYLQILAEQGLVGLGLFVFFVVAIIGRSRRGIGLDPLHRCIAVAWGGQLVLFLWNAPLFYFPIQLLFWVTAGVLDPAPQRAEVGAPVTRPRFGVAAAAAMLLLASAALVWTKLRSGILEQEGDALLERGPFPAAVARYQAALGWTPQNGYAWEKLGLAQYFAGDYDAALESLDQARARFGDVGIRYLEAEILTRRKDYPVAVRRFEYIRDAFPQHVTPSFTLGQIHMAQGDYRRAEREFVRVLSLPDSPENLKLDRKKIRIQKDLAFRFLAAIRRRG